MRFRLTVDATFEAESIEDAVREIDKRFRKAIPTDGGDYLKMDGVIRIHEPTGTVHHSDDQPGPIYMNGSQP